MGMTLFQWWWLRKCRQPIQEFAEAEEGAIMKQMNTITGWRGGGVVRSPQVKRLLLGRRW